MRRVLNIVIDLVDGILAAVLYGGQGGLTYTTTNLEAQNKHKMRSWAAGIRPARTSARAPKPDPDEADLTPEQRIIRFRQKTRELE